MIPGLTSLPRSGKERWPKTASPLGALGYRRSQGRSRLPRDRVWGNSWALSIVHCSTGVAAHQRQALTSQRAPTTRKPQPTLFSITALRTLSWECWGVAICLEMERGRTVLPRQVPTLTGRPSCRWKCKTFPMNHSLTILGGRHVYLRRPTHVPLLGTRHWPTRGLALPLTAPHPQTSDIMWHVCTCITCTGNNDPFAWCDFILQWDLCCAFCTAVFVLTMIRYIQCYHIRICVLHVCTLRIGQCAAISMHRYTHEAHATINPSPTIAKSLHWSIRYT